MSSIQESKYYCDGCEKKCELWADIHKSGSLYTLFYICPMIGNMSVNKYIDESGKECVAGVQLKNHEWDIESALERARHQARLAAKQCPHYHKTK